MLQLVSLVTASLDGIAQDTWKDDFGWSCRDYGRLPEACDMVTAVNAAGVHVSDVCFVCSERRRETVIDRACSERCTNTQSGCNSICQSSLKTCTQQCDGTLSRCQSDCQVDNAVEGTTLPPPILTTTTNRWWIPLVAILVGLCLLCLLLGLLCMLCRPQPTGDCNDCAGDQQPMVMQMPAAPACGMAEPAPCDSGCEPGYPQGNGYEPANQQYGY